MGHQQDLPVPPDLVSPLRAFNREPSFAQQTSADCVHSMFEHQVEHRPDAVALRFEGASTSYRALNERADRLAQKLRSFDVGPGQLVAVCMLRSPDMVVALLGILKSGAAYVPLDAAYPAERLTFMLRDSGVSVVISQRELVPSLPASGARLLVIDDADDAPPAVPSPARAATPDDLIYTIYTSGSTGLPKGAMNTHAGLVNQLRWFIDTYAVGPADRVLLQTQFSFDVAAMEFFSALCSGATLVIAKPTGHLDTRYMLDLIDTERVTSLHFVPSILRLLFNEAEPGALASVRQVISAGEALPPDLAQEFLDRFEHVKLHNLYGPAECAVYASHWDCSAVRSAGKVLIGRPVGNTRLYVLGANDVPAEIGDAGELCIAGIQVGRGYLNRADLTAEKFVPDPFAGLFHDLEHAVMYRTGDLARWLPDGNLEYLGRLDFQVKISGQRVELGEVEAALARCEGVREAVVVAEASTDGDYRLAAYLTSEPGVTRPDSRSLRTQLIAKLPAHMVPSTFVMLATMPLSPNGKVDRKHLTSLSGQAPESVQEPTEPLPRTAPPPPATLGFQRTAWKSPEEGHLAAMWSKLLGVSTVDRESDFTDLGGSSMAAMRLSALIRRELRRDFSPIDVLRFPVLHSQAAQLAAAALLDLSGEDSNAPMQLLTQHQQALLAASALDPSGCAMHVHIAIAFTRPPDWTALRHAVAALWRRHPMLQVAASPHHARILNALPIGWWSVHQELEVLPDDLVWPSNLLQVVSRPLDTGDRGPMRVDAWPLRDGGGLMVWTVHHYAIDEASIDHCLSEIRSLVEDRQLPAVYGSPFAFSSVEKAWIRQDVMSARIGEFTNQFANVKPPLPRAPATGAERLLTLPEGLGDEVLAACSKSRRTPFVPLLTAFASALQDVFGPEFRQVLSPFSRRSEPELAEPVGYLLDVRHIEAGRLPDETLADTLERVDQQVREAHAPSFLPLDKIAEEVARFSPNAAACLGAFAFTWRLSPTRELQFGESNGRLIRIPQSGARFGLTLHAATANDRLTFSIEAVQAAFDSEAVDRVALAFEQRLRQFCMAAVPRANDRISETARSESSTAMSPAQTSLVQSLWCEALGEPVHAPERTAHFIEAGGSSMAAMRLGARARKLLGARLDVGAFLAEPTYERLCALLSDSNTGLSRDTRDVVLLGPKDFDKVILFLPGRAQEAVGLFKVATELRALMDPRTAVAIFDLQGLVRTVQSEHLLDVVFERLQSVAQGLGPKRIAGIAGFSLGGLLALQAAGTLGGGRNLPVWLLDTYSPAIHSTGWMRRIERSIAWRLYHRGEASPGVASASSSGSEQTSVGVPEENPELWNALMDELLRARFDTSKVHATLIQAESSMQEIALLRHRASNGFNPSSFGSLRVCPLPTAHLDLVREASGLAAHVMAATVST